MGVKSRTSLDGTYHSREDVICESYHTEGLKGLEDGSRSS